MSAPTLGPLEFIAGEWIVGDPTARESRCLKLEQGGLGYWVQGVEAQVIPWSRLMDLRLSVQPSRLGNSRTVAVLTDLALALKGSSRHGGGEACLAATLRNPYEDWVAHFSHASRNYRKREIRQAEELFRQTIGCGRAAKLGDPQWVAETVEKIASLAAGSRDVKALIGGIVRS